MLLCFLRRLYSVSARLLALVPLTRVALMMPPSDTDAVPAAPRAPKEGAVGPSIRRRLDSLPVAYRGHDAAQRHRRRACRVAYRRGKWGVSMIPSWLCFGPHRGDMTGT